MGSASKDKSCPHCHTPVSELTGFCPYCGEKLSDRVELTKEKTLQAKADPDIIRRALKKKPSLKEEFQIETPVYAVTKKEKIEEKKKADAKGGAAAPPAPTPAGVKAAPAKADEETTGEITEEISVEPEPGMDQEIELISQYGPVPIQWWQTVPYFIRVLLRKRELKAEIKEISDECIKKRDQLDADLLVVGHRMMRDKDTPEKYPREVDAILVGRSRLEATGKERISEEHEMEDKEAYLNDEVVRTETQIASLNQEEQTLRAEEQQRGSEMKQSRAKIQKYNIEVDKITRLIQQAGKGPVQPDLALIEKYKFQIMQIERGRAPEEIRVSESQQRLTEIDHKMTLLSEKLKEEDEKLALARKRKEEVVVSLNRRRNEIAAQFHQKHNEYNKCLRDLGLAAFNRDDLPKDLADQKEKLRGKIASAQESDGLMEKHLMAMESFDPQTYKKGMIFVAVGGGILGVTLIGLAVGLYFILHALFT